MSRRKKSSKARIDASRANGALSRGPVTPEGKARSSRNGLKHGLAASIVLRNESQGQIEALVERLDAFYQPTHPVDEMLIHQLAAAAWRSNRIVNMENALIDHEMDLQATALDKDFPNLDHATRQVLAFRELSKTTTLSNLDRYEARHNRTVQRVKDLLDLSLPPRKSEPRFHPETAPEALPEAA